MISSKMMKKLNNLIMIILYIHYVYVEWGFITCWTVRWVWQHWFTNL